MDRQQETERLIAVYGGRTKRVIHELNLLIGETLGSEPPDIMGFGFISQAVSEIMIRACELAGRLQAIEQGHAPGPGTMQ